MISNTGSFSLRHIDKIESDRENNGSSDKMVSNSAPKPDKRGISARDAQKLNELIQDLNNNKQSFQHTFYIFSCLDSLLSHTTSSKLSIYEAIVSCDGLSVLANCIHEVSRSPISTASVGSFRISCGILNKLAAFSKTWCFTVSRTSAVANILSNLARLNTEQLEECKPGVRLLHVISANFPQSLVEANAVGFIVSIISREFVSTGIIGLCVTIMDRISKSSSISPLLNVQIAVDKLMALLDSKVFQDQKESDEFILSTVSSISLSKSVIPQTFVGTLSSLYSDYIDNRPIRDAIESLVRGCDMTEMTNIAISDICSKKKKDSIIASLKLITMSAAASNLHDVMMIDGERLIRSLSSQTQSSSADISRLSTAALCQLVSYIRNPLEVATSVSASIGRVISNSANFTESQIRQLPESLKLLTLLASDNSSCDIRLRESTDLLFSEDFIEKIDFADNNLHNVIKIVDFSAKAVPSNISMPMVKFVASVLVSTPHISIMETCLNSLKFSIHTADNNGPNRASDANNDFVASSFIYSEEVLSSIVERVSYACCKEFSSSDQSASQSPCMFALGELVASLPPASNASMRLSDDFGIGMASKLQETMNGFSVSADDWVDGKQLLESLFSMRQIVVPPVSKTAVNDNETKSNPDPPAQTTVCQWRQQLHENGCVYFVNIFDGQAQWNVPQEWIATYRQDQNNWAKVETSSWKPNALTVRVIDDWSENIDSKSNLLYYENVIDKRRQVEKPSEIPLAHEIPVQLPEAEPTVKLSSSLKKKTQRPKRATNADVEKSQTMTAIDVSIVSLNPQPTRENIETQATMESSLTPRTQSAVAAKKKSSYSIQELVNRSRELSAVLRTNFGAQNTEKDQCIQEYEEILTKLHKDMGDRQSSGGDLFLSFVEALEELLRNIQQADALLSQYRMMEVGQSLQESIEMTMSYLKGEVTIFTEFNLTDIVRCVEMATRNEASCEKMFREAHLQIKRIIVGLIGDQPSNTVWNLTDRDLKRLKEFERSDLLRQLRILVVCFDNMTADQRLRLTAVEIVKNKDWLIKLGKLGLAIEKEQVRRSDSRRTESKRSLTSTTSSSSNKSRNGRPQMQQQSSFRSVSPVIYHSGNGEELNQRAMSSLQQDEEDDGS